MVNSAETIHIGDKVSLTQATKDDPDEYWREGYCDMDEVLLVVRVRRGSITVYSEARHMSAMCICHSKYKRVGHIFIGGE